MPLLVSHPLVPAIRDASRKLVRELGFMGDTVPGTDLHPSAVHAIMEIGDGNGSTASALCSTLNLEKSSVSRMLRKLILTGDVVESQSQSNAREKTISLSPKGIETLASINAFAGAQVAETLSMLPPASAECILSGIQTYASALRTHRTGELRTPSEIKIVRGYQAGLLARTLEMQAGYYTRTVGFGLHFETEIATGLAEFLTRLENPLNEVWSAIDGEKIIGTIFIDGQNLGENKAHLRAFIVADGLRGSGIGRRLLESAMAFVEQKQFIETHLWTHKGLDAARKLYNSHGFVLQVETPRRKWGVDGITLQEFVRKLEGTIS